MIEVIYNFVIGALPDAGMIVFLTIPLALFALISAASAGYLKIKKGWKVAYTRKVFHFMIFIGAGVLQVKFGLPAVVLFGIIVSALVLVTVIAAGNNPFYLAIARPKDHPREKMFIIIPLITTAVGGVMANLFFGQWAYLGYLVCGAGDAAGEPIGAKWGKHSYKVPSLFGVPAERSIEGSIGVFVIGSMAVFAGLAFTGCGWSEAVYYGIILGAAGALVEAVSNHGLDNLTIQVVVAGVAWWVVG